MRMHSRMHVSVQVCVYVCVRGRVCVRVCMCACIVCSLMYVARLDFQFCIRVLLRAVYADEGLAYFCPKAKTPAHSIVTRLPLVWALLALSDLCVPAPFFPFSHPTSLHTTPHDTFMVHAS